MDEEELLREKLIKKKALKNKVIRNVALTVICIVLGVVVAFEYKSIVAREENDQKTATTITEAQARIIELSADIESLNLSKSELEEKLRILEEGTNDEKIEKLQSENELIKKFAALTDVYGQGVIITLSYENPSDVSTSISTTLIQSLMNELKNASAQAISINGERVLAMTEVKAVDNYLVVNGNSLDIENDSKITISVIGNPTSLESSLGMNIKSKFDNFFATYGGSFKIEYENNIYISGYSEDKIENRTNMMFDSDKK